MSTFKFFPRLNQETDIGWVSSRRSISLSIADRFFASASLQDQIVRCIAEEKVLPIKEVLECFEFVARIRKYVRRECVADLCCGHGLVGILLGAFEREIEHIFLVDKKQPPSHKKLLGAIDKVAPWVRPKVNFQVGTLKTFDLPANASVVSAHACGILTDTCIDLATSIGVNVGVMPCCYPKRSCKAPEALLREFGEGLAFDIDRTYRLEQAGYKVAWTEIPDAITPMNRVIIGKK